MDVPSWHPANQDSDAARRLLMAPAASTKRTEFKVMAGSSGDTSTEAGRQLMSDLNGGADAPVPYEGRGFFDTSDRLYLLEQKKIQEAQKSKRKAEEDAQLQSFRSTALKLQAQKPSVLAPEVVIAPGAATQPKDTAAAAKIVAEKKPLPAIVTIKPKKRAAPSATESDKKLRPPAKKKKGKEKQTAETKADGAKSSSSTISTSSKATAAAAPGALLLGYSSSSDSDA